MNTSEKSLLISVSGIRGTYPAPLSPEITLKLALAYGTYLKEKNVLLGRDTRISGEVLNNAVISGLLACGKNVTDLGIVSTPAITFFVEKKKNFGGVIITASHNPADFNGIKFLSPKGTFLNSSENNAFLKIFNSKDFVFAGNPGIYSADLSLYKKHFDSIYKNLNVQKIRAGKFKVIVDPCQGAGALVTGEFLKHLGCSVKMINLEPLGNFSHNPEPLPENIKQLCAAVLQENADIGFAQDPDADRLAIVSEKGKSIGEELTVVFAIEEVLRNNKGPVVVNLSTTSAVEQIAKKYSVPVYRSKIGEVNVVEKMKEVGAAIGGEGNGGVIWPKIHYGRDSFAAMGLTLQLLCERNKTASEIMREYPKLYMLKTKILIQKNQMGIIEKAAEYYKNESIDLTDGIKVIRKNGWIQIRTSGTEPIIRIYAETKSKTETQNYIQEAALAIKNLS